MGTHSRAIGSFGFAFDNVFVERIDHDPVHRTDDEPDTGTADMGHHGGAGPSMGVPAVEDPPGGGGALTLYVDQASGSDARTRFDAGDPATPWQTLNRALQAADGAQGGDVVSVQAGT